METKYEVARNADFRTIFLFIIILMMVRAKYGSQSKFIPDADSI